MQYDDSTIYQKNFIDDIAYEAQNLQNQTHLFASITIAQAILESDWGRSQLATEANNLFGIKGTFNNQSSIMPTDEVINGERITIDDSFKKYATIQESMVDHINFLKGATYEPIKTSNNYKEAAIALQNGGYATDPNYAEKLIELIEEFQLDQYDK
ncbi:glycoside hydrolase family 73 protein [Enterococcus rivorum]|uniref:glycoside hydrolase family 73 protein n=1 Tax=Enterococcus rivorum TaxID=762845 RepID=UPI00363C15D8